MKLSPASVEAGAAANLDGYVAANLRSAVLDTRETLPDFLEPAEAGFRLASAMVPLGDGAAYVRSAALCFVEFEVGGKRLAIPADAVPHHPLLAPWITRDLGEMVGKFILAGAILTQIAPGAPIFEDLEMVDANGRFWVVIHAVFTVNGQAVKVMAQYGERPLNPATTRILRVDGGALLRVGEVARNVTLNDSLSAMPEAPPTPDPGLTLH